MRTTRQTLRDLTLGLIPALLGVLGLAPLALGQGTDQEPNNTCESAESVGNVALPFTVNGSLDTHLTFRMSISLSSLARRIPSSE